MSCGRWTGSVLRARQISPMILARHDFVRDAVEERMLQSEIGEAAIFGK